MTDCQQQDKGNYTTIDGMKTCKLVPAIEQGR